MKRKTFQYLLPTRLHPIFEVKRMQPGAAPGTLVGHPERPKPTIEVMAFGADEVFEKGDVAVEEIEELKSKAKVLWVNVDGLGDAEVVASLGKIFGLHPLSLEDVLNIPQRAKVEVDDDRVFFIARMARAGTDGHTLLEQVSIFLGKDFVLTFQERPGDVFEPIRQRIRSARGRLSKLGPDYLAYTLLDAIIDGYFPVLEAHGEALAEIEALILGGGPQDSVAPVYRMKRELLSIRRAMWPQRDALHALYREPTEVISDETRVHLRDIIDHSNHIIDLLENYREISASLLDLYLSMNSQRMNEIMKVLTIIATIFIPLTFIAGVYGMNFDPEAGPLNMPELAHPMGYPAVMFFMLLLAAAMLVYFRRKGWLGPSTRIGPQD
jgi:magnesium transporter